MSKLAAGMSPACGRIACGVTCAAIAGIGYGIYWYYSSDQVNVRTWFIDKLGWRINKDVRPSFQKSFKLCERGSPKGHSHPGSAALRTSANCAINDWCYGDGNTVYSVSAATRDHDDAGYHQYYMAKDVVHPPANKSVSNLDVIKMIDVDYYLNMTSWLKYLRPVVLYTFVPSSVAGPIVEGCFTICDNSIKYHVSGGAEYKHQIWDYSTDWIVTDYWWGSCISSIEQREVGEDRRVILVNPEMYIYGPIGWLLPGRRMRRVDFKFAKGVNRLDYVSQDGVRHVSVGLEDAFVSVNLRYALYEAIRIRLQNCKKAEIHAVERYLNKHPDEYPNPDETAAHLFEIFQRTTKFGNAHLVPAGGLVQYHLTSYQSVGSVESGFLVTEDGSNIGRAVAPSLVDNPGVVPCESYNNDLACIIGRIERPYNACVPPENYSRYAVEFAQFLVPKPGIGSPWSIEQVLEVQQKPAQRGRNERVIHWLTDDSYVFITAFMKHESYGSINDPRNISQVPTEHTLRLSSYAYPFKIDVLKPQKFYGCGMNPTEIAERVHAICAPLDQVSEIDYSRWDGSFSIWMRAYLERSVYLRWCHPKYRSELGLMLEAEVNASARTRHGVAYIPAGGRESGSAITSDANTIGGAGVAYFAGREAGLTPREAFDFLGIFVGDDGVTGIRPAYMESTAEKLGLQLKCAPRSRGQSVHFLGRVFHDPFVSVTSVQDPVRTLKKLHISFADKSIPDEVALYNRASGYLTLDPNAPIVSSWCQRVLELITENNPKITESVLRHYPLLERDLPYYSRFSDTWPQLARDDPLAFEIYAKELAVDSSQIYDWDTIIRSCERLTDVYSLIHVDKDDKIQAVTNDDCATPISGAERPRRQMPSRKWVHDRYKSAAENLDRLGVYESVKTTRGPNQGDHFQVSERLPNRNRKLTSLSGTGQIYRSQMSPFPSQSTRRRNQCRAKEWRAARE